MEIVDNYFGGCPECGKTDGYLNVGKGHWFFCKEHKTKWIVGANLFSSWQDETEEEQRKKYDEVGLGSFREVEPLPEGTPVFQHGLCLSAIINEVRQYAGLIVSGGLTAISKAGDQELHEAHHELATNNGYFTDDAGVAAVALILIDAIVEEFKRREKQPDVNMRFSEKCPPWLRSLVQDAVTAGINKSRGRPDINPQDDETQF